MYDTPAFWCTLLILLPATIIDIKRREVPHWVWVSLLLLGFGIALSGTGPQGFGAAALGMLIGFGLGALLFASGGFGGGDAKLLAGLGAIFGPLGVLVLVIYVAIAGGVAAMVAHMRGWKEFPYVPAITAGTLIFLIGNGRLPHEWFQN